MNSPSAVVCREIFDENSQPSAEEISEYAQQLGIDPESESHLLPLAKDGLMQALPAPWKAYYDEKLQTHYYFNEETKITQWEHPLDKVYRELVRKTRDVSTHDDTCASVQELLTSEEITKHLEKMETKVDSGDEDLSMDNSEDHVSDKKETQPSVFGGTRRLAPLIGRPPLAPVSKISDKKFSDLRVSSLRKNLDGTLSSKPNLTRTLTERDISVSRILERPKLLKQQSEIIDLKMNVLSNLEEENSPFSPLSLFKSDRGLSLSGMGNMFLKTKKTDLPSPDTEKSLPLDSITKSDPPKGILREKLSDTFLKRSDSLIQGKSKHSTSTDEDKKSVRFKLEQAESTISPSSNSSSEQNEGQSSIVSATPVNPSSLLSSCILPSSTTLPISVLSPIVTVSSSPEMISSPPLNITSAKSRILSPLSNRPSIPPRPQKITEQMLSPKEGSQKGSISERDSIDSDGRDGRGTSPRRRVLRPPAADYIKPDLFQKNFLKISDLVRPGDIEAAPVNLEVPIEKDTRPRSPLIPLKNKISINLMENIDSETSVDSPDKEFENLDLNDLDDSKDDLVISKTNQPDLVDEKNINPQKKPIISEVEGYSQLNKSVTEVHQTKPTKLNENQPHNILPIPDTFGQTQSTHSVSDEFIVLSHPKLTVSSKDDSISINNSKSVAQENDTLSKGILKEKSSPQVNSTFNTVLKSPRFEVTLVPPTEVKPILSPLSSFSKPNFSIKSPLKTSDSISSISNKSPRLDAVMLSQNRSKADDNENVVVVYQFETTQDVEPSISKYKSPLSSTDNLLRDTIQRAKAEERKKLELMLQKELEEMRAEWADKERKMRSDLMEALKQNEEKFKIEKEARLFQQKERHRLEMDQALQEGQNNHDVRLKALSEDYADRLRRETETAEKNHAEEMSRLREEYSKHLAEEQKRLQTENDRALSEMHDHLTTSLNTERARLAEENRLALESLREEHNTRISDLRHDYRAEVERLRAQHACHLEELRARLAGERARRGAADAHALADKYRCLKEKYARLKHDVKMSIERRNKRRELSMTTGSETEKSNSHKVTQSLERCKEQNETSVSVAIESERAKLRTNNNLMIKCNDNETSISESNVKSSDNNNENWRNKNKNLLSPETSQGSRAPPVKIQRRATVAFREPCVRKRDRDNGASFNRLRQEEAATTDCQDSSDTATTADEKPKETLNGHGRRRCFTRLKSASTSRLNYSPKRGEGWCSPLESLRQQLRKLDDLEDQFPDLACQPSYSLRYPFAELGAVSTADTPELEFVRHRALVEREGMRRARAALRRRRAALRETHEDVSPHRAPSEEREATELEVALHRARALLGEKEIRLKHIERALRRFAAPAHQPPIAQEETTSDGSSHSSGHAADPAASGAVLRSLRALHADVRDIWLALDARRPATVSPETSSCNAASTSQPRHTVSAEAAARPNDATAASVAERARGLRAWLQTAP